jgi:sulfur relay (sulfurtransferase) complex TusBCD TusD component (DsrE family)
MRKAFSRFIAAVLFLAALSAVPAFAGGDSPLFINMTSNDPHRALMAIGFGRSQMQRGHPLTIFLNDHGVLVASKKNAEAFAEHQAILAEVAAAGATVLVCPTCSKAFGVPVEDFCQGARLGNPELTGGALFKDGTVTLSW